VGFGLPLVEAVEVEAEPDPELLELLDPPDVDVPVELLELEPLPESFLAACL
jgi:hypothetical protein